MSRSTEYNHILEQLPYDAPFLFVDTIHKVTEEGAEGGFTFAKESDFYRGHFKDHPVTPGVLLTECCAQIGLVCLGIHLLRDRENLSKIQMGFTAADMDFILPVYPGETVRVRSEKIYFRFHKLKCRVHMYNTGGEIVCKGVLSGMFNDGN